MSTTTFNQKVSASPAKLAISGAIAGLAGGAVFGITDEIIVRMLLLL